MINLPVTVAVSDIPPVSNRVVFSACDVASDLILAATFFQPVISYELSKFTRGVVENFTDTDEGIDHISGMRALIFIPFFQRSCR